MADLSFLCPEKKISLAITGSKYWDIFAYTDDISDPANGILQFHGSTIHLYDDA